MNTPPNESLTDDLFAATGRLCKCGKRLLRLNKMLICECGYYHVTDAKKMAVVYQLNQS